jgi:hypothetical protein
LDDQDLQALLLVVFTHAVAVPTSVTMPSSRAISHPLNFQLVKTVSKIEFNHKGHEEKLKAIFSVPSSSSCSSW